MDKKQDIKNCVNNIRRNTDRYKDFVRKDNYLVKLSNGKISKRKSSEIVKKLLKYDSLDDNIVYFEVGVITGKKGDIKNDNRPKRIVRNTGGLLDYKNQYSNKEGSGKRVTYSIDLNGNKIKRYEKGYGKDNKEPVSALLIKRKVGIRVTNPTDKENYIEQNKKGKK